VCRGGVGGCWVVYGGSEAYRGYYAVQLAQGGDETVCLRRVALCIVVSLR